MSMHGVHLVNVSSSLEGLVQNFDKREAIPNIPIEMKLLLPLALVPCKKVLLYNQRCIIVSVYMTCKFIY